MAVELAAAGARVAISGRDEAGLEKVAAQMGSAGVSSAGVSSAVVLPADLLQSGAAAQVAADAARRLGGLDVVVSNAGAGWAGPMTDITPDEIDALVDLNLRAPLHLIRAALPQLAASDHGRVIIVGSAAGRFGVSREVVYSATKGGLYPLAEGLRAEVAGTGVTVSMVTPGVIDTAFYERRNKPYEPRFPRPVPATRVADAVLRCARSGQAEIWVPAWLAVAARIDGVVPALYRWLARRFG